MADTPDTLEGQDLAEVFDETNITEDGEDIATSDQQRDLLDVTSAEDDADEDDARAAADGDFDPDALDEAEYEEIVMADEDLDEPRSFVGDNADRVRDEDASPADFEAGDLDDADDAAAADAALDEALKDTFPASDPRSIDPGAN